MNNAQFGRKWQLDIIGENETLSISTLRVAFTIDKTINEKPNPATIYVWNLNRSHLNAILSGEFTKVALAVGYNEIRQIYSGDIVKARVKRSELDFVLELSCADGFKAYTMARTATTLKSGANDRELINEIQKTMPDIGIGAVNISNQRKLPRARVLNGDSRDLLTRLAKNSQADWSVQDGNLVFLPKNKVLNETAVLLSQDTGMVNAPSHTDDGLELECLLNPALQIGGLVKVESILDFFNGEYKIVKLVHSGDGAEGEWLSKITVVGGKFEKVENDE